MEVLKNLQLFQKRSVIKFAAKCGVVAKDSNFVLRNQRRFLDGLSKISKIASVTASKIFVCDESPRITL